MRMEPLDFFPHFANLVKILWNATKTIVQLIFCVHSLSPSTSVTLGPHFITKIEGTFQELRKNCESPSLTDEVSLQNVTLFQNNIFLEAYWEDPKGKFHVLYLLTSWQKSLVLPAILENKMPLLQGLQAHVLVPVLMSSIVTLYRFAAPVMLKGYWEGRKELTGRQN